MTPLTDAELDALERAAEVALPMDAARTVSDPRWTLRCEGVVSVSAVEATVRLARLASPDTVRRLVAEVRAARETRT